MKDNIWQPTYNEQDYELLGRTPYKSGTYLQVHQVDFRYKKFDEEWSDAVQYSYITRADAVNVLIFHPKSEQLVLIEQFRLGPTTQQQRSPWMLECVAGLIDEGETAVQAAIREVKEEAGLEVSGLESIMAYYPSPGCLSEYVELFYVEVDELPDSFCHGVEAEGEDIKVHLVRADTVRQLLTAGDIINLNTICALQWFLLSKGV